MQQTPNTQHHLKYYSTTMQIVTGIEVNSEA